MALICKNCGGENVGVDAWADPNTNRIIETFDHAHCFDCDGQTRLVSAAKKENA